MENSEAKELDIQTLYCLLDHCRLGIIIADAKGMILWGNDYYSAMAGFNIKDFIGQDIRIISRRNLVTLSGPVMADQVLETGEELTDIVTYPNEDFIATTLTPVRDSRGEIRYLIYSVTNCSESIRMQSELNQLNARNLALESQLNELLTTSLLSKDIIISDNRMKQIYKIATRLASVTTSVMILGESGVGKDVYAKFIHSISNRKNRNFIHVNLGAIPKSLFESELFGYEAGAFTGASKTGKTGLIELADGGTLFLDEIGNLSLPMQAKLLTAIEKRQILRLGATRSVPIDVRLISATNMDIHAMVQEGTFRQDLLYRINTIELHIPPLRERGNDILLLADYFLDCYARKYKKKIGGLTRDAKTKLQSYAWPGNVRELQHAIERAVILSDGPMLRPENFMLHPAPAQKKGEPEELNLGVLEKEAIERALRRADGNITRAAELLGITRFALYRKLDKLGL